MSPRALLVWKIAVVPVAVALIAAGAPLINAFRGTSHAPAAQTAPSAAQDKSQPRAADSSNHVQLGPVSGSPNIVGRDQITNNFDNSDRSVRFNNVDNSDRSVRINNFPLNAPVGVTGEDAPKQDRSSGTLSGTATEPSARRHQKQEEASPGVLLAKTASKQWLNAAAMNSRGGQSPTLLGRFQDDVYFTTVPVHWEPRPGQRGIPIRVPSGFVVDFASVPPSFWALVSPPHEGYLYPMILREYLYWFQPIGRSEADAIIKAAMNESGFPPAIIDVLFKNVRFDELVWMGNAGLRSTGVQRLLARYPLDASVSWSEWRTKQVNFARE